MMGPYRCGVSGTLDAKTTGASSLSIRASNGNELDLLLRPPNRPGLQLPGRPPRPQSRIAGRPAKLPSSSSAAAAAVSYTRWRSGEYAVIVNHEWQFGESVTE